MSSLIAYTTMKLVVIEHSNQKHTPRVAAEIVDYLIAWYDDVDNKILMCFDDVDITLPLAIGFLFYVIVHCLVEQLAC